MNLKIRRINSYHLKTESDEKQFILNSILILNQSVTPKTLRRDAQKNDLRILKLSEHIHFEWFPELNGTQYNVDV